MGAAEFGRQSCDVKLHAIELAFNHHVPGQQTGGAVRGRLRTSLVTGNARLFNAPLALRGEVYACVLIGESIERRKAQTYLTNVNSSVTPCTPSNLIISPPKSGFVVR
jgi:hypothetical protein